MRHLYLVAYDISHPRRLNKVMKVVRDFGERLQLSVYLCQLSEKDLVVLRERLRDRINQREDQVVFVRLGLIEPSEGVGESVQERMQSLGRGITVRDLKTMIF